MMFTLFLVLFLTALVIILMKLYSYSQVMAMLRVMRHEKYPENLSVGDMYYFLLAPTLVYEPDFPRTESIRWRYVFKMVFSFVFFSCFDGFHGGTIYFPDYTISESIL